MTIKLNDVYVTARAYARHGRSMQRTIDALIPDGQTSVLERFLWAYCDILQLSPGYRTRAQALVRDAHEILTAAYTCEIERAYKNAFFEEAGRYVEKNIINDDSLSVE